MIISLKNTNEYYNVNQQDYHRHYVVVACGYVGEYGYKIMDYYELRGDCTEETESDIYNEFLAKLVEVCS